MEWTLELLLFLLFNGLLFCFTTKAKNPTTSNKHIPVFSWIFRFETVVPFLDPTPKTWGGVDPWRIWVFQTFTDFGLVWFWLCHIYTQYLFICHIWVQLSSSCFVFFLPPKVIYWWTSVSKQKTKELKKLRVGKEKQKHTEFCYRLVLPSCWCLKIGPCPSWFSSMAFLGWKSKSYATARTPGWSGVESTVHRPGLGMMKLSPPVLRWKGTECAVSEIGKSVMNIHFYMETTNNYTFYTMSMIHHLNSNAFLISWYVYVYIYKLDITFHVFINQFSSS